MCADLRCPTVLSVYNPEPFCWRHETIVLARTFGHLGERSAPDRDLVAGASPDRTAGGDC